MLEPDTLTAVAAIIAALTVLVSTIASLVVTIRTGKAVESTAKAVEVVHELVNSHSTAQNDRIDQLTEALTDAGTSVPARSPGRHLAPEDK